MVPGKKTGYILSSSGKQSAQTAGKDILARIVATVDKKPSFETVILQDSPAPTAARIVVVLAFPRELDRWLAVPLSRAIVNPSMDSPELELTHPLSAEFNESGHDEIDIFPVPEFHLQDAPRTLETVTTCRPASLAARHFVDFSSPNE